MVRAERLQDLLMVEERIRSGISSVRAFAPMQFEEVFTPIPGGLDLKPAALYLLSCRTLGLDTRDVVPFACAIEALALSFRSLSQVALEENADRGSPAHGHGAGNRLLLADGFLLMSYRFLSDLDTRAFRRLAPLLAGVVREMTGCVGSYAGVEAGIADVQRSLAALATRAAALSSDRTGEEIREIDSLVAGVDRLLSAYRECTGEDERVSVLCDLDRLARSVSSRGAEWEPLSQYVALVADSLSPTS